MIKRLLRKFTGYYFGLNSKVLRILLLSQMMKRWLSYFKQMIFLQDTVKKKMEL